VYAAGQRALAASAVLGLDRLIGTAKTPWDTSELTRRLGVHPLRTVEQVLRQKAALPAG
jgi:hypothetical protein